MPYCVNCGHAAATAATYCGECHSDPGLVWNRVDAVLDGLRRGAPDRAPGPEFSYPGERLGLVVALVLFVAAGFFLSLITFTLFFWMALYQLLFLRLRLRALKSGAVEVSRRSFPRYVNLVRLAAYRLHMPPPPVYIVQSPELNAYATGFWGDHAVVLNSALVEQLEDEELLSVIGHEFGHVKCEHATWQHLVRPPGGGRGLMFQALISTIFNNWSLRAEYTADRAGLIACRKLRPAVSTQLKLMLGGKLLEEAHLERVMAQLEQDEKERLTACEYLFEAHPLAANRIRQLASFARSDAYQQWTVDPRLSAEHQEQGLRTSC